MVGCHSVYGEAAVGKLTAAYFKKRKKKKRREKRKEKQETLKLRNF
ncbi:MAG: hypothetical protein TRG1_2666 [Flavobacteriaceae bacterium FS1-H7996/R]|nr:MAG: hypothetical protein TRG1_2666 [Flavobacteriaceae bacterium FS1-H7996/R]